MSPPRQCFYIPEGQRDEAGYIPSLVTEGEPGHAPLTGNGACAQPWHWGTTYQEARAICDRENARLGLTPAEATDIVLSSMTVGQSRRRTVSRPLEANERRQA
jgi:hypothetical protein